MLRNNVAKQQIKININLLFHPKAYLLGLLISEGAKTCTRMSESLQMSHDVLQKILASETKSCVQLRELLYSLVHLHLKREKTSYFIIDDSALVKQFARVLEGLGLVWDSAGENEVLGYKLVVLVWSNAEVTMPLDFRYWFKNGSKTKLELAQEMLACWKEKICVDLVLMDGLYASREMLDFLDEIEVHFVIRFPKSRLIQKNKNELNAKIGDHWQFRLQRNSRTGFFKGYINGKRRFIVASKRRKKNGEYGTVFLVTNFKDTPTKILSVYAIRWNIEKFFRTAKQKLGLQDCQARRIFRQSVHIFSCFAAFGIAETIKVFYNYENADEVIRMIRAKKIDGGIYDPSTWRIFYAQIN